MKSKIYTILCVLFGLMFFNAGLNKIFNYIPMPDNMPEKLQKAIDAYNTIGWIMPMVGIVEMLAAVLIIIPRTRALGAVMAFPVMLGILVNNFILDIKSVPIVILMLAILGWIAYKEKAKIAPLFG